MLRIDMDDILGMADGTSVFADALKSTEKYKQTIIKREFSEIATLLIDTTWY